MARNPTQWAFDYEDLSRLTDISTEAIRQAKSRGDFNPDIFGSVVTWVAKHGTMQIRRELMEALLLRPYPKSKQPEESGAGPRLVPSPLEAAPKKKSAKKARARS